MYSSEIEDKNNIMLTKDETSCYETLMEYNSEWAQTFLETVYEGRDQISARLISSIYRENLVNGFDHAHLYGAHQLVNSPFKSGNVVTITFTYTQRTICAKVVGEHAFNRIDIAGPFYWKDGHTYQRIQHPNDILKVILQEDKQLDGENAKQFYDDLENSAANMTMALSYHQRHHLSHQSILHHLETHQDPYLASEQNVIEGHPLHPGAKLRKGMTTLETIQYASEYAQPIQLKFILVHRDIVRVQSPNEDYSEVIFNMFDGLKQQAVETLEDEATLEDYAIMIIHPWQYDHVMHEDYQNELDQHYLIPLDYTHTYYAGLSFRTLMPQLPDCSPHIKLSTNVHITGEIRTLSEQTTHNGPLVSRILDSIMEEDHWFDTVAAQHIPELAGAHFYASYDDDSHQERRSEQLGTLYRQNIYDYVESNDLPVIASSLVVSYGNKQALMIELIERYMRAHSELDELVAIESWFKDYATALVDFVVPLLVKYGIALEAHLQNSIAVFNQNDGSLNKMFIRDFEGLRIDVKQLNKAGYDTTDFHEKSRILTDSQTTVFNKAFYSTIQNHLGELVATIVKHYSYQDLESHLWQYVSDRIQSLFSLFYEDTQNKERIQRIESTFFNETIDYKCVTTMRLLDEAHEYTYIKVNNPL